MSLHHGAKTKIIVGSELSKKFSVQVGGHQGSVLLPMLFAIAVDAISENRRKGLMNKIVYADDLFFMNKSIDNLR